MAHVKPLPKTATPELTPTFDHYENTRGFIPNSILTMLALNKAVLYEGTVSEELKMLVSLIASQAAGCKYCQAHMANLSQIYSASAEKIAAVWKWETSPLFSDAERAALTLAFKGAVIPNEADEAAFAEVRKHFNDAEIVEIVASIALFGYLNRWNDTMATDLEDHAIKVANETIGSRGWTPGKHAGDT